MQAIELLRRVYVIQEGIFLGNTTAIEGKSCHWRKCEVLRLERCYWGLPSRNKAAINLKRLNVKPMDTKNDHNIEKTRGKEESFIFWKKSMPFHQYVINNIQLDTIKVAFTIHPKQCLISTCFAPFLLPCLLELRLRLFSLELFSLDWGPLTIHDR